jgi:hypothetical protein
METLCGWIIWMAAVGAVLNFVAAYLLIVLSPSRPRYQRPTDDLGLRRLAGDQSKIAGLVVLGGALQLAALILGEPC